MKQHVFILLCVCFFGWFSVASAQLVDLPQADINITMTPPNPGPNQVVYVSIESYGTNLNSAKITWKLNGKIIGSGIGEKTFNFNTGSMNSTTGLGITIETQDGNTIEKTYNIKPTSVDLIWESGGFVPPFYKGKSLFSHQNIITITAIPHITSNDGTEINSKNLIYKWKKNGSVISSASGYGQNSLTFVSSLISRPFQIDVEVTTTDREGSSYANISLNPSDPSIIFYKKDPIFGIQFQKALVGTIGLGNSKEINIIGFPLFYGTTNSHAPELIYKWLVNGVSTNNSPDQSTQIFRQNEGTSGMSKIGLSIENSDKILQYTTNSFNLTFGN